MIPKKNRKWIWLVAMIFLLTNWPLFKNITGLNQDYYRYSNISGTYTRIENQLQGRMYKRPPKGEFILNRPNFYGCNDMPASDTVVYRLFAINPLKFWRWSEYIFDWRYRLPYKNWGTIKKNREILYPNIYKGCRVF